MTNSSIFAFRFSELDDDVSFQCVVKPEYGQTVRSNHMTKVFREYPGSHIKFLSNSKNDCSC